MRCIPFSFAALSRCLLVGTLLAAPAVLSGCWLFAANEKARGVEVTAEYTGLQDKSLAIVIYTEQATVNEFPAAREELSSFIAKQIHENIPTARLLDPRQVIRWQDETINWFGLTEKDIGTHFGVDRVLMIELLGYSTRSGEGYGDLQGNIRASARIFETDGSAVSPAWRGNFDVRWPKDGPLDVSRTNELVVRKRVLEVFTEKLVRNLYTHREMEKALRTRE